MEKVAFNLPLTASHTHTGLPEEAPSTALLVTCPQAGWSVLSGQTCQGKRRNQVINISRGQALSCHCDSTGLPRLSEPLTGIW